MDDICEVIITAPDADWLAQFTTELVAGRLAACGHNIGPIRSIYRWQGEIHDAPEARVAPAYEGVPGGQNCGEGPTGTTRTKCRASLLHL